MKLYSIRDWPTHFETCETRKLNSLHWWPKPNKHDGLGFRRMAAHRNKVSLYCAWILIGDVASKTTPRERRGYLERGGRPLTADDLACMTGWPESIFVEALDFFSHPSMAWLDCVEASTGVQTLSALQSYNELVNPDNKPTPPATPAEHPGTPGDSPGVPGESPGTPAEHPGTPGDSPAVGKGREGKGIEGNGMEGQIARARFAPPTLEEVQLHTQKIGMPESEAFRFWNYYNSNGWRVGKNPMRSWPSAMANWKTRWETDRVTNSQRADHRAERRSREYPETIKAKRLMES